MAMAILTNCIKLCNISFSRNIRTLSLKNNAPQLFNTLNGTQKNIREISESPKESVASTNNTDITHTLLTFKYLRLIKRAIRESGPIAEENQKLETLLSRANKLGISPDYIEVAQRISVDSRVNVGLFEMFLFSNCHFIVQYEDFDLSRIRPHISRLCEGSDAFMGQGNVKWPLSFEQKGIILVSNDDTTSPLRNFAKAQAISSKAGAELVKQEVDVEGSEYLQFISDPGDLHKVKQQLDEEGCEIEEAYVGYIPKNKVAVSNLNRNAACRIINELHKIPFIDNIYINIL